MTDLSAAPASAEATPSNAKRRHPMLWVPSLYVAMGTPMITVSVVAAIMYKNLGLSNTDITLYTSSMYLPWVIKPLWSPVVEMFRTKRFFVLCMEFLMMVTLGCVALSLSLPSYLGPTLAFFWITGFASATQDIAADGIYISSMSETDQAKYAGVQGLAWNVGRLIASGLLVTFTGWLHNGLGLDWAKSWMVVMGLLAALMGISGVWHINVLPTGGKAEDAPSGIGDAARTFGDAFASFFKKKNIVMMLLVVFFYRFGEGLIEKIGPLFMLDPRAVGGLGLDNEALGNINGTFGTGGFIVGALLGGLFCGRLGLKRSFVLLALALNVPHLTYFYLSHARPEDLWLITAVVTIEKFGYGFGSVGHMVYMMQQLAPGPYKTAHYAFATGIMGLSMMFTGMISGPIQEAVGHAHFFTIVLFASIPPVLFAFLAPFAVTPDESKGGGLPAGH
ncbi:MFS transporter [Polyangium fumosum]|uniref:MFS transporter n=1 Tax=Polyangium fumosum TaxID=889272 RepID=A0A4V6WQE1_9BACT|nr:MFS transporter [Polyangium fumosum]TKC92090.1 MFS transporter [Polyangium fumosum]